MRVSVFPNGTTSCVSTRMTPASKNPSIPTAAACRASIQVCCPRCDEVLFYDALRLPRAGGEGCPGCGLGRVSCGGQSSESGAVDARAAAPVPDVAAPPQSCWYCSNDEFYVQKDFNRKLGVWIVTLSALSVFLVMLLLEHRVGILLLLLIALLDAIVYHLIPTVAVCYLCQGVYRRFPLDPRHRGFYLGSEEKYKHLRQDWLERVEVDGSGTNRPSSADDTGGDRGGS